MKIIELQAQEPGSPRLSGYRRLLNMNLCPSCAARPPEPGMSGCAKCLATRARAMKKYYMKNRKRLQAAKRRSYYTKLGRRPQRQTVPAKLPDGYDAIATVKTIDTTLIDPELLKY